MATRYRVAGVALIGLIMATLATEMRLQIVVGLVFGAIGLFAVLKE